MAINKLVIDMSGRGGLSDNIVGSLSRVTAIDTTGINLRYLAEENQMVSGVFNPLTWDGYMSPSVNSLVSVTPAVSFTQIMAAAEVDELNGDVYFLENGTKIQKATGLDDLTLTDDRTITNGTGMDTAIYEINGVRHLFYAYRYSTTPENRIGIKNLVTGSYVTDNWLGTGGTVVNTFSMPSPDTTYKTVMIPAGDGFMYILNKNVVHRVDGTVLGGTTGTIYPNLLTAPLHFFFSHGLDYRNNLYLVVQKNTFHQVLTQNVSNVTSQVGVYIWNRQSSFFNTSDFIPIYGMREIRSIYIAPNNKLRIIGLSSSRKVQIREYNGTSFVLIKELPPLSFPQFQDSLRVVDNFTVWQGNDGKLWYHGSEKPGEKELLFVGAGISTDLTIISGAIAHASLDENSGRQGFYVSFSESGTETLKKVYPFGGGTAHIGDIYTPVRLLPRLSTVKHIDVYMKQFTHASSLTTVSATLKIYFNNSTTAWASKSVTLGDINKGYLSIEVNKPFINSIQIEVENSVNQFVGDNSFAPSFAVVEYDTTKTLR